MDAEEHAGSFEHLALLDSAGRGYNLSSGDGEPEQVSGVRVTASFFPALGYAPLIGRTFLEEEEQPGRSRVVVLTHRLWQRRYGGARDLIGRAITIDGEAFTVVGVMPPELRFQFWSGERELFVPAGWTPGDQGRGSARPAEESVCSIHPAPTVLRDASHCQLPFDEPSLGFPPTCQSGVRMAFSYTAH